MNGKTLMIGLLAFCAIFGAGLWYAQIYAFYDEVEGVEELSVYGDLFPVSEYRGIEATTSPLKQRACFTVDWDWAESEEHRTTATPLTAPYWFDCFDAEQIARDIEAGKATVYLAEIEEFDGADRYIAHYEDGRAFMWRQLNEKYAK